MSDSCTSKIFHDSGAMLYIKNVEGNYINIISDEMLHGAQCEG